METRLHKLQTSSPAQATSMPQATKKIPIADSWEDDADSPADEVNGSGKGGHNTSKKPSIPAPPPPTPASPQPAFPTWNAIDAEVDRSRTLGGGVDPRSPNDDIRRQEKSTAVASRMIAAGLGVKAPKRTEEQRAYDRAAKENEIKRKNREKEDLARQEAENEKAKAAVWDA